MSITKPTFRPQERPRSPLTPTPLRSRSPPPPFTLGSETKYRLEVRPSSSMDIDDDSNSVSLASSSPSLLSEESDIPPPPLVLRTLDEETEHFLSIYKELDSAFAEWELTYPRKSGSARRVDSSITSTLNVKSFGERNVIFGRRPDGDGYWRGWFGLTSSYQPVITLTITEGRDKSTIYGTEIGGIYDFECYDAALWFGVDRRIYYTSIGMGGDVEYLAEGPYDLRDFRSDRMLDPDECYDF